ncbi:hypothetical protein R1sor_024863 [Riccia sorocarpa]|uniref:Legume lectin domain-containing protein n=1 Tax=Riccia sorocarpa TaxID=122646 RepID=A0ABD3GUP6_9MARC
MYVWNRTNSRRETQPQMRILALQWSQSDTVSYENELEDLIVQMFALKLILLLDLLLLLTTAVNGQLEDKMYYFVFSPFEPYFNNSFTYGKAAIGDGYVSLTSDGADREFCSEDTCIGRVYYKTPGRPYKGTGVSFSTNFVFGMFPTTDISSSSTHASGDGIVFFLGTNATWDHGQPDGRFGLFSDGTNFTKASRFFAIEFDTMKNEELEDVDDNHIGLDNNSPFSSYYESANKSNIVLNGGKRIEAWIDYDNTGKKLEVRLAYHQMSMPKPIVPLMSVSYDLDQINLTEFYPGFSASSRKGSQQRHILYTWEFNAHFVWQHDEDVVSTSSSVIGGIVVIGLIWFCCVRYTRFGKQQHARCMDLFGPLFCRSKMVQKASAKNVEGEAVVKKNIEIDDTEDNFKKKSTGGGAGGNEVPNFSFLEDNANINFKTISHIHPMLVNSSKDKNSDEEEVDEDEESDKEDEKTESEEEEEEEDDV